MILHRNHRFDSDCEFEPRTTCHVAAAILGGSALTAGASIFGSSAASSAQSQAIQQGIALQREMFGKAENALSPFINMGQDTIGDLQDWFDPSKAGGPLHALLQLVMPGSNMNDVLAQTPGYQFTENRGLKAVDNALAKRGLAGSGGAVSKGAADFVTGLSQNTWQSVVNALSGVLQQGGQGLSGIVGQGVNAGGMLGGNAITTGGQMGNSMTNLGNAQAGGIMGMSNALGNFGGSIGQAFLTDKLLGGNGLSSIMNMFGGADKGVNPGMAGGGYLGAGGNVYAGPGLYSSSPTA